jgi:hypothetical protein
MFRAMIHRLPESRPIPYPFLEGMPERSDVSRHDRYFACRHRRVTSTTDDQPHQPVEQIARRVEKAARRFEQRARRAGFRYLAGRGKSSAGQAGAYWTKNGVRDIERPGSRSTIAPDTFSSPGDPAGYPRLSALFPIWRATRSRRMVRARADSGVRHGHA